MRQVETVLVSLDGSGFSRSAIPAAGRFVARLGAGICLPCAVGPADEVDEREAELVLFDVPGCGVARAAVVDWDAAGAIDRAVGDDDRAVACMASVSRFLSSTTLPSAIS